MASDEQGFIRQLFSGHIEESMVAPYPQVPKDERENMTIILDSLRKFAAEAIDPARHEREKKVAPEVIDGLREMGGFGAAIPEEYGGLGFTASSYCRFMEEVGRLDASTATTMGAHQSIGLKALLLFGNDEQKKSWLPRLATGEVLAAFALTEPEAGSDAASLKSSVRYVAGEDVYVLNGTKQWITNGGLAGFFTVFAKHEEMTGEPHERISAFIVESTMPGFTVGKEENKLGLKGSSTCQIHFENVKVPAKNLIGEKGKGFKIAVEVLNTGRTGLGAGCVGGCKEMIRQATEFAVERKQFGQTIASFEMIREKLARMTASTYALEAAVYLTTAMVDRGIKDYSLEGAVCKVFGTETLWSVINDALQIAGGNGFMEEYPYGRYLRDARINMIFEGTNEILRLYVALNGVKGPGKRMKELGSALTNPAKAVPALFSSLGDALRANDRFTKLAPEFELEAMGISEAVGELSAQVRRLLRKHRAKIMEREYQLERLADIAIDVYVSTATLSRASAAVAAHGRDGASKEIELAKLFVGGALDRIRLNLEGIDRNLDELRTAVSAPVIDAKKYPFELW